MARYCPSCGTRLDPAAVYTADDFEDALADVLDAPVDEPSVDKAPADDSQADEAPAGMEPPLVSPDSPTVTLPTVTATTPSQQSEWTAQANDWTAEPTRQAGTWTATTPAAPLSKPRGNRTLWIILAILGFIVFCCCGSFFALLLVAESDTAFQEEISRMATLWIG